MILRRFLLLSFVFLAGCNFQGIPDRKMLSYLEPRFSDEIYSKGGKAYVILDAYNNVPANFTVYNYFIFENENGEEFRVEVGAEPKVFMLSPGKYVLKNFSLYGSVSHGNTTSSVDLDFDDKIEGEFTVGAGESVYLGKHNLVITKVNRRLFSKLDVNDIEFEAKVLNDYDKIINNRKSLYEMQSGKKPVVRLIKLETY